MVNRIHESIPDDTYGFTGGMYHSSQYTVKAYSKDSCAAANEIAERVFNTPLPSDPSDH